MPKKAQDKPEFLQEILQILVAFSVEIKKGVLLPKDITRLQKEYANRFLKNKIEKQDHKV